MDGIYLQVQAWNRSEWDGNGMWDHTEQHLMVMISLNCDIFHLMSYGIVQFTIIKEI